MYFFVRHGERGDQVEEEIPKIINPMDVHLTETGAEQARSSGKFIRETLDKLVEAGDLDSDYEIILCSSPYYRCLQTSKGIFQGLDKPVRDGNIFAESAIEEFNNPICKYDGTQKEKRFLNNYEQYKLLLDEIFTGITYKINTIFDYNVELLNSPWEESWENAEERFRAVSDEIGKMFESGKENPRKTVFVLVSHGIFPESFYKIFFDETLKADYCAINHIKLGELKDGHYEVEVLIKNHLAWK